MCSHQSKGFYGGTNSTRVLSSQTPGPEGRIFSRAGTSFDALVQEVAIARDMVRSAPTVSAPNNAKASAIIIAFALTCHESDLFHCNAGRGAQVPVHPWLAPKFADWGKGYSYLSSGNASTDEIMMWEEHVFHQALSTATTEFLWWQPGEERPTGLGLPLLSRVLSELGEVTGLARSTTMCALTPIETNLTRLDDFAVPYLMSAMSIQCNGKPAREVYRFTPRCTKTIWCTWWDSKEPSTKYPPANGTVSPSWRIGSGFNLQTPDEAVVWLAKEPVSTAGAWLVRAAKQA